ncbi:hypothetical protein ANTPLA_LOCUS3317 [Anthophora plagiata]
MANLRKTHFRFHSHFHRQSSLPTSPVSQPRKIESKWSDKLAERVNSVDQQSLALKIERKSTKAILKLWNKLKPRKNSRKKLGSVSIESLASVWNHSHVEGTMSSRSQRGTLKTSTTKRYRSPRLNIKSHASKPPITYDYDAAISQPDVPHLLDRKRIGRGAMVSGVSPKKKPPKSGVRCRIMSSKNFQKRSQELRSKSLVQKCTKARSPDGKSVNHANKTITSPGIFNEQRDGKENVTSNGTVGVDKNLRPNLVVEGKSILHKDRTKEVIEGVNDQQIDIRVENESDTVKSPVLIVKGSKIPRAKVTVYPVHTSHEFQMDAKLTATGKQKNSTCLKCPTITCPLRNVQVEIADEMRRGSPDRAEENSSNQEMVRFEKFPTDTKIVWNIEETSTLEADEEADDREMTSTDESPIISSIDDPRVQTILRSLKLNCPCKSCTIQDPPSSSRQEDDSDLKSSSPEENRKKWETKRRKYNNMSIENANVPSDCNSEDSRKKKRSRIKGKSTLSQRIRTSAIANASPKASNRRRSNFSFFNTLFDIVFWPYMFLKAKQ